MEPARPRIRVCVNTDCCSRGSERSAERLRAALGEEADIETTGDCFRYCQLGPNVAVDGHVLHGVTPERAVAEVRRELSHPRRVRTDGVGTRSIDELDSFLDAL